MRLPLRAVLLVLAGLAFFLLPATADFLTDWLWFGGGGLPPGVLDGTHGPGRAVRRGLRGGVRLARPPRARGALVAVARPADLHHARRPHRGAAHARSAASARDARGRRRGLPRRVVRVEPLAHGAHVVGPRHVRRGRSDPRLRRVLLRLHRAVRRVDPRAPAGPDVARRRRRRGALRGGGTHGAHPVRRARRPRRAPPSVVARRRVLRRAGPRRVALAPAGDCRSLRHHPGRQLRGRARPDARGARAGGGRPGRRRAGGVCRGVRPAAAADRRGARLRRRALRRAGLRDHAPAVRGHAERAGARDAVHRVQHRRHAQGLRPRSGRGARSARRRRAHAQGHRGQPGHARERAPVGSPAAARDLRADPGNPHLLRLRVGGQRPLHDRRAEAAGHALGARAQPRGAPQSHLGQRAARLHPRPRPHARTGQPGDVRGPAGALREGPAAGVDHRPADHRAQHLLRRARQRLRHRPDEGAGVPLSEGR